MKYIKIFEAIDIDKEEIKLWMVDLLDKDFDVRVYNEYDKDSSKDGISIRIHSKNTYQINDIIETLYFVTDMIKSKYNLELDNNSLVTNPNHVNHITNFNILHKVDNFYSIIDSTITNDTAIIICYKPSPKGIHKLIKKFNNFDPIQITKFATDTIISGTQKINNLLKK
jgi:hypothetical protein